MEKGKTTKPARAKKQEEIQAALKPKSIEIAGSVDFPSRTRLTQSEFTSIASRYPNLWSASLPYQYNKNGVTVSDAVILCQKAYCRVPVFKNCIDTMAELANVPVYLKGGNAESLDFFEAWFKRIGSFRLGDMFFRELFRSGTVIYNRVDGKMTQEGARKLKKVYAKAAKIEIPLRYILLNPAYVAVLGTEINMQSPIYFRILDKFQLSLLKNSSDPDDKEVYKNVPQALKSYFDGSSGGTSKPIPLDPEKIHAIFYKKQDYEPFPIPMGFPVLDSIELKLAMQKCDAVLARTAEHVMLLVTTGAEKDKGGINPVSFEALKQAFSTEQIGRVLVADYTTEAKFVTPELNKVLGPEKYQVVNQDISEGLFNILGGGTGEKFSNMMGKLKVFVEKINNAQEIYINEFLLPEIKRISKLMGFKSYPIPHCEKLNLDDQTNILRIYSSLIQMGVLTPKDGMELIERGDFPDYDTLYQNQLDYKKDKDKGLFQPIQGGPYMQTQIADMQIKSTETLQESQQEHTIKTTKMSQKHELSKPVAPPAPQIHISSPSVKTSSPNGRPPGTKSPQTTKTVKPQGGKASFSMAKMVEIAKLHSQLSEAVEKTYKKKQKVKKLEDFDKENIDSLIRSVVENEAPEEWVAKASAYVENPVAPNMDNVMKIEELAGEYGVNQVTASLLFHSLNEEEVE